MSEDENNIEISIFASLAMVGRTISTRVDQLFSRIETSPTSQVFVE